MHTGSNESFMKSYFSGLTFAETIKLFTVFILAIASGYLATHDIQTNKARIELEELKTKQVIAQEETKKAQSQASGSSAVSQNSATPKCYPPFDQNLGSYVLNQGACVTFDNSNGQITQQPFSLGSASQVVSIGGDGDFTVFAFDGEQLSRCDSDKTEDRCAKWISDHQKLGNPDAKLQTPRYWLSYAVSGGKIIINTAS